MKKNYLLPKMAVEDLYSEQIIATSVIHHISIDQDASANPEEADCPALGLSTIFD